MSDQAPQESPFEPMPQTEGGSHPHDQGKPMTSTRDLARSAVADAVRGPSTATPGSRFTERSEQPLPSEESQFVEPAEQDAQLEGEQPTAQEHEAQPAAEDDYLEFDEEAFKSMISEVELPVSIDEVPEEFVPIYAELAQSIIDTQQHASKQVADAQYALNEMKDFVQGFQTPEGRQRLLLGMAMNAPDVFNDAVEVVQRMQDDPQYAEAVKKNLEADIKLEQAQRAQRTFQQQQISQKAHQVESRATRLAKSYGIDEAWAKELVAQRILANEARTGVRDITLAEVDEVIQSTAKRMGRQRRHVKRPATTRKESQSPTRPVEGAGKDASSQPAPSRSGPSPQPPQHHADSLRAAVRRSADRIRKSGL